MLDLYKDFWQNIKISSQHQINSDLDKKTIIQQYLSSPFLSPSLGKKLERLIQKSRIHDYIVELELDGQGIVYFHFISNLSKPKIQKLIRYYFFVVYLRTKLPSNPTRKFNSNIVIYIFPISESKKFVKNIGIHEMNSASTNIHPEYYDGNIYLWRKDDIEKVMIHEALHSVHYDFDIINQKVIPELKALEKNGFNRLNINEAYTELCAIYLYNILKLPQNATIRTNRKKLRALLLKDLEYSLKNSAKLLKINGISSIKNLLDLEGYRQEAAAFSYIILRTGLLWSLLTKCKSKIKGRTDRLECLDDFLNIGFTGRIGIYYQYLLLDIIKNKAFSKEIMRYMENSRLKEGKKMILAI
jgi:hypothetical protein